MGLAQYEGYEDSLDEEWKQHLHGDFREKLKRID